jgi:transcriptional regulator with GAF, ATPase, and Fis domain
MALVVRYEGPGNTAAMKIGGAVTTIGRVTGNDLVVPDPRISSRHGRILRDGDGYSYEDLDSRNGSLLERAGERTIIAPHRSIPIHAGDHLLLGDRVSPVALIIDEDTTMEPVPEGGTIIACRSVIDPARLHDAINHPESVRELFHLLHELSGAIDSEEVLARISSVLLTRFTHAESVSIMMQDTAGAWVTELSKTRSGKAAVTCPSRTLLQRAVSSREIVSYVPGTDIGPESVAGLAGAVLVPLLANNEPIGVLHVDSPVKAFTGDALAWFSIVGTHLAASLVAARRFRALSLSAAELQTQNKTLRNTAAMPSPIVGQSASLLSVLRQLEKVGRTQTTVLVLGETGTGKELAARYIHAHSGRAEQIFCPINCGALSEDLLNSELFGHKKGSFTGADRDRKGLFEAADGGTVFLDEIGEVTAAVQVRLLRVLQEREVQPVGTHKPIKVDVRIVAATNRKLEEEVKAGRFREDLYYRLAVFAVKLPPLRERSGDIELLAERFRELACARHDAWVGGFSHEAMRKLEQYHWPGNIRQLEHEIERAVIMAEPGNLIGADDLSDAVVGDRVIAQTGGTLPRGKLREVMAELEERLIRRCLDEHGANRTRTAEVLGISRQALQTKLAKWRDAANQD